MFLMMIIVLLFGMWWCVSLSWWLLVSVMFNGVGLLWFS